MKTDLTYKTQGLGCSDASIIIKAAKSIKTAEFVKRLNNTEYTRLLNIAQGHEYETHAGNVYTDNGHEQEADFAKRIKGDQGQFLENKYTDFTFRWSIDVVKDDTYYEVKTTSKSKQYVLDTYLEQLFLQYYMFTTKLEPDKEFVLHIIYMDAMKDFMPSQEEDIVINKHFFEELPVTLSCVDMGLFLVNDTIREMRDGLHIREAELPPIDAGEWENTIKQYNIWKAEYDRMKPQLTQYVLDNNIKSLGLGNYNVTYKSGSTRTTLDTKSLQADHPDIYNQYTKQAEVSPSVVIKEFK